MADNEPDRYAIGREFDPRRTQRENTPDAVPYDPRRTQREGTAGPAGGPGGEYFAEDEALVGLPRPLREAYSVLRELPNPGAEADVLLVIDAGASRDAVTDADLKVVKIYRRNIRADQAVWAKIRTLSSDDIVRFVDTGTWSGRDYEVMEYLPGGNLTQLAPGRGTLPTQVVAEVVRQVAGGLIELHRLGIVHRDLKPENVLVRRASPLDVVVTDFGLSRAPEQSVVAASRTGTLAYLSPETLLSAGAHSSKARDWWALGMIARELLTGVRPFEEMTEAAIHQALLLRPVDLSDIADPRTRLLCRGLLLRDPADRWGEAQVREWLAGGSPAVAEEHAVEADGIKPFSFQQVQFQDRKALARAFAQSWDEAARRYFVTMGTSSWRKLQEWLEQFDAAAGQDAEGLYAMIDNQLMPPSIPPDVKLLTLLQWLDPELPPVYRGQRLDQENLAAVAAHAAIDHEPAAEYTRIIGDLHRDELLPRLARMHGGAGLAEVHLRWRDLDARFGQRARAVDADLPKKGRQLVADADNDRRQAALLFLAADPQPLTERLREHTARQADLLPAPVPWFDQIRAQAQAQPDPVDDALLLTLFPLAARDSAAADQDRRQREEIAQRNEQTWAEHEHQRLEGAPGLPRAVGYSSVVAVAMLVMFIISIHFVHNVLAELGSGLVGLLVAGMVFIIEVNFARQLGSDYAYFPPTAGWGRALQRAGSHIHGAARGILLIVALIFGVPIVVSAAFGAPAVVYALLAIVQLRSWQQRRKRWLARHEQEHRQVLERAA